MRVGPIKDRLIELVPEFKSVAGAMSMAVAMQQGQFAHHAYVFQSSRKAQPNQLINAVSQRIPHSISVAYWLQNVADATGEQLADEGSDLSDKIVDALVGWKPPGEKTPLFYVSGDLADFRFGRALWIDVFTIDAYLRKS